VDAPRAYTPQHLAEKILTSKTALEGERKQVTVLFADLKGSMDLFAGRDPEEARRFLDPVVEHMMEAVHRYEGTVNHVLGDGIVALFGAPISHEDHAIRACYAALRMQENVSRYADEVARRENVPIQIRVGLNSGEVVVRSIGNDLRMDYTVVGQTTNVAARLEQMAVPSSILISPETKRLAEGFIEVRSLGPHKVKGLEAALEIYQLLAATKIRSRFQAAAARGLTAFVGRKGEVDHLIKAVQRIEEGHGQALAVIGEAGVGKSRLFWEFSHVHCPPGWRILECSSVSYGRATSYLPAIELLRGYFGVDPKDDPQRVAAKVRSALRSLDEQLETWISPILSILDAAVDDPDWERLDPPQRRQRILDGIKCVLLRESQKQPLIVVLEDLHWIDTETQALLDSLVESLPAARVLLLVNYRPEYIHRWVGKSYYHQLRIDPLEPQCAEMLLDTLLGRDASLRELKRLVVERTEGNPFFIEETVSSLRETGVLAGERGASRLLRSAEHLQVPATAQAILAARIDRLDPDHKRFLQAAAVLGTEVPLELFQAIADESPDRVSHGLAELQASEFLYPKQLFPSVAYTFRHALTHEVAYGSLLAERRRILHARIVTAIEQLYPERITEHVEALARHALRGQVWDRAVLYLRQAGSKAAARSALPDARSWLEQAIEAVKRLPESHSTLEEAFEILLELRSVLTQLGELRLARERLQEAESLAEQLSDDHRRARVSAALMTVHSLLGDLEESIATGNRALDMAARVGDLRLRISTTSYLEQAHYYRGDYESVVQLAEDALAVLPADWVHETFGMIAPASVYARSWLVISLAELGRFGQAMEQGNEAIRLAEASNHAYTIGLAHRAVGTLYLLKGEWLEARSQLEHAIEVLRAAKVALSFAPTLASCAWALAQLGEMSEAVIRLHEGEEAAQRLAQRGRTQLRGWDYHALGRACLLIGEHERARSLAERAVELVTAQPGAAAHALNLLGDIASSNAEFDSAEADYRRALALGQERGMRPLIAHSHFGLAKLFRRKRCPDPAGEHLTIARMMYQEMAMSFWTGQAKAEIKLGCS
jgi:predicted ATPase/class 3 adenylate cyclase